MKEIKPGYKETPIGILPRDWEVKSLGEVGNFLKGKGISKNDISNDGIECIRYGELYTTYNEVINKVVSRTNIELSELIFSEKNDVIIPSSGETALDIARASCILMDNIALGGDLNIFRGNMNGKYLSYYINSLGKIRLSSYAQGASVIHLYSNSLKNFLVPIPPKEEQEKIAQILMTWDEAIEKQEELIEQEKEFKKGMMQKIFNQELRFKDENGNDYPEWEEKRLGKISDVRDGTHDSPKYIEKGYPFITSKNLMANGQINFKDINYISKEDYISINKRSQVTKGDILFGMIGTIGNPVIVTKEGFAIKNVALIKEKDNLKNNFLLQLLKSSITEKQFHVLNVGGTQKFISLGLVRDLKFNLPSLPEQEKIADFLSIIDEKIEILEKKLEELKEQKKGLMQKLLTGEVRV